VTTADVPATGADTRVYLLERALMIEGRSHRSNGLGRPTHALSATLIVAHRNPVTMKFKGMPARPFQGALLSPRALRESFEAKDSDFTLLDIDVAHPAYLSIEPRLRSGPVQPLPEAELRALQDLLRPRHLQPRACAELQTLVERIVAVLAAGAAGDAATRDPRICRTLELIERLPFNELSLSVLARRSCLSESRLRHLFSQQMGCTLSQYIRWVSVHRAMDHWKKDEPLAKGIEKAGFADSSHFYHAFRRHFSMTPTVMGEVSRHWAITRCGKWRTERRENPGARP
jgi:AraC-like DNA-binding protein